MAAPPTLGIPENQAVIAAGVEPDGTRSGIALDADGKIILSPTGGGGLPVGAATEAKQDTQITRLNLLATAAAQTDGTQRTGVLGLNGITIATNANPLPSRDALSSTGPTNSARKLVPTGAAEPIVGSSTPATQFVRVCADPANTVAIYVAGIGQASTTNSIPMYANDVDSHKVTNADLLECITGTAGQYLRIEVR